MLLYRVPIQTHSFENLFRERAGKAVMFRKWMRLEHRQSRFIEDEFELVCHAFRNSESHDGSSTIFPQEQQVLTINLDKVILAHVSSAHHPKHKLCP